MTRRHWFFLLGSLCLILCYLIYRNWPSPVHDGAKVSRIKRGHEQTTTAGTFSASPQSEGGRHSEGRVKSGSKNWEAVFKEATSDREVMFDKWTRVQALYDSLTEADWEGVDKWGPHPRKVEILVEGMDAFTAAKYLDSLGGHSDYVKEYAGRAVAENPGDFEVLLFYAREIAYKRPTEAEAAYRQLLAMAPNSTEVLTELGNVLSYLNPQEAIGHLQKAIQMEPDNFRAHDFLAASHREVSYEIWDRGDREGTLAELNKSLAAYQKAYQLLPNPSTQEAMDMVKEDIEWTKTDRKMVAAPKDPQPQSPLSEEAALSTPTEAPVGESRVDESPIIEPSAEQDDTRRAEARQAMEAEMEAEFEKLLADYERMIIGESDLSDAVESDLSAAVKGEIADLERESKPKLSPDDDPDDERGRRKSESNQKRRERSTERSEDDEDGDDARADEDASEEDEER